MRGHIHVKPGPGCEGVRSLPPGGGGGGEVLFQAGYHPCDEEKIWPISWTTPEIV